MKLIFEKEDAIHMMVNTFNRLDKEMLEELMFNNPKDWKEVTVPDVGDEVYVYDENQEGEIVECFEDEKYSIEIYDDGSKIICSDSEFVEIGKDQLPMWGWLWQFDDEMDNVWLERNGIKIMSKLGFRIYKSEKYGYFFGIDGAGYDFYEKHWTPLYEARGLKWHI